MKQPLVIKSKVIPMFAHQLDTLEYPFEIQCDDGFQAIGHVEQLNNDRVLLRAVNSRFSYILKGEEIVGVKDG